MAHLVLLDGNALIHRAFHGIPPTFQTQKGEITNAVFGFTSVFLTLLRDLNPEYIAVAFDMKGPTFRHLEYEAYKATRVKAPDILYAQIPRIRQIVESFGIPIFEKEGFEADDVVGTIAYESIVTDPTLQVSIVSGDMDLLQLVQPRITVVGFKQGLKEMVRYTPEKVFERYGFTPAQVVDYKALKGDPSDNIPGVRGVGDKTATELLQKYGTLDTIYAHLDELTSKQAEKFITHKAEAYLSQKLARLVTDVPIHFDLQGAVLRWDRQETVRPLFEELEFRSLWARYEKLHPSVVLPSPVTVSSNVQLPLFE